MRLTPFPTTVNFKDANVLLLEQSQHTLEVAAQMLRGFGVGKLTKCTAIANASAAVRTAHFDLFVVDPNLRGEDGHDFICWLRRSGGDPNRFAPVVVTSADGTPAAVARARDAGANTFMLKPVTPALLLDRIIKVLQESRFFVPADTYVGPDRRRRIGGPPPGVPPRRHTDIKEPPGAAAAPASPRPAGTSR